jgi:hypothetical protein
LAVAGNRRAKQVDSNLKEWARENPVSLFEVFFRGDPDVRLKVGNAIRSASYLARLDPAALLAIQQITGFGLSSVNRRPTALGDIQWLMFTFNMGIIFGAILPPLAGLG